MVTIYLRRLVIDRLSLESHHGLSVYLSVFLDEDIPRIMSNTVVLHLVGHLHLRYSNIFMLDTLLNHRRLKMGLLRLGSHLS